MEIKNIKADSKEKGDSSSVVFESVSSDTNVTNKTNVCSVAQEALQIIQDDDKGNSKNSNKNKNKNYLRRQKKRAAAAATAKDRKHVEQFNLSNDHHRIQQPHKQPNHQAFPSHGPPELIKPVFNSNPYNCYTTTTTASSTTASTTNNAQDVNNFLFSVLQQFAVTPFGSVSAICKLLALHLLNENNFIQLCDLLVMASLSTNSLISTVLCLQKVRNQICQVCELGMILSILTPVINEHAHVLHLHKGLTQLSQSHYYNHNRSNNGQDGKTTTTAAAKYTNTTMFGHSTSSSASFSSLPYVTNRNMICEQAISALCNAIANDGIGFRNGCILVTQFAAFLYSQSGFIAVALRRVAHSNPQIAISIPGWMLSQHQIDNYLIGLQRSIHTLTSFLGDCSKIQSNICEKTTRYDNFIVQMRRVRERQQQQQQQQPLVQTENI